MTTKESINFNQWSLTLLEFLQSGAKLVYHLKHFKQASNLSFIETSQCSKHQVSDVLPPLSFWTGNSERAINTTADQSSVVCYIKQSTLTEVLQPLLFIYLHFSICVIIKLRVEKEVRLHFNLMHLINSYICNPALNTCAVFFWQLKQPAKATCVHSSHYATSMLVTTVKATEGIVGYQRVFWWFPATIRQY